MKQCIAWAGLACLLVSGCAQNGLFGGKCCQPCHVAASQNAPRPQIMRNACRPGCDECEASLGGRVAVLRGQSNVGCEFDESCYSCSDGCGCGVGEGCSGSCQGRSCGLIDRIAGGFCRCGAGGCGLGGCGVGNCNPHAGGYPEATMFNAGQPTGQVAYPYYTVRGPRDFLRNNPPSIGPY